MNLVDELLKERAAESTTWMERSVCRAEVERYVQSGLSPEEAHRFPRIGFITKLVARGFTDRPMPRVEAVRLIWNIFHPERGQDVLPAKELCARCPVSEDCLEYALTSFLKQGVWGGLSERERRGTRKLRRTAATSGERLPTLTPGSDPLPRCSSRKANCDCRPCRSIKNAQYRHPGHEAVA